MRLHGFTAILSASLLLACNSATPTKAPPRTEATSATESHEGHAEGDHGRASEASDASEASAGPNSEEILAAEKVAYERARPLLERHCAKCHTSSGSHRQKRKGLPHFSMDSYPFGGHHATEMAETIRDVLGQAGEDATMPKDDPGAVQGEELALILAWADAFERSHEAGLHKDHGGHGGHKH